MAIFNLSETNSGGGGDWTDISSHVGVSTTGGYELTAISDGDIVFIYCRTWDESEEISINIAIDADSPTLYTPPTDWVAHINQGDGSYGGPEAFYNGVLSVSTLGSPEIIIAASYPTGLY